MTHMENLHLPQALILAVAWRECGVMEACHNVPIRESMEIIVEGTERSASMDASTS